MAKRLNEQAQHFDQECKLRAEGILVLFARPLRQLSSSKCLTRQSAVGCRHTPFACSLRPAAMDGGQMAMISAMGPAQALGIAMLIFVLIEVPFVALFIRRRRHYPIRGRHPNAAIAIGVLAIVWQALFCFRFIGFDLVPCVLHVVFMRLPVRALFLQAPTLGVNVVAVRSRCLRTSTCTAFGCFTSSTTDCLASSVCCTSKSTLSCAAILERASI